MINLRNSTTYPITKAICCILLLFGGFSSHAQFKFGIGPKVGIHTYTTSYRFDEAKDRFKNLFRFGFTAGGSLRADLADRFTIVAELQYSLKGKKTDHLESSRTNIYTFKFIEGPLLLRYKFPKTTTAGIGVTPYVNVGPNVSYWLKGAKGRSEVILGPGTVFTVVFDETAKGDVVNLTGANRWQFGIDFGAGLMVDVTRGQTLAAEIRFTLGHTFLGTADGAELLQLGWEDNFESNYRVLSLTFAYQFEVDLMKMRKGQSTIKNRKRR